MNKIIIILALNALICLQLTSAKSEWSDKNGRTIKGEYVYADDEIITILRDGDTTPISFPIDKLSKEDEDYVSKKKNDLNSSGTYSNSLFLALDKVKTLGTLVPRYYFDTSGRLTKEEIRYNPNHWLLIQKISKEDSKNPYIWIKTTSSLYDSIVLKKVYVGNQLSNSFNSNTKQFFEAINYPRPDIIPTNASIIYKFKIIGNNISNGRTTQLNEISTTAVNVTEEFLKVIGKEGIPHRFNVFSYKDKLVQNLGAASDSDLNQLRRQDLIRIEIISATLSVSWSTINKLTVSVVEQEIVNWPN